jgi:hypothetical protein
LGLSIPDDCGSVGPGLSFGRGVSFLVADSDLADAIEAVTQAEATRCVIFHRSRITRITAIQGPKNKDLTLAIQMQSRGMEKNSHAISITRTGDETSLS